MCISFFRSFLGLALPCLVLHFLALLCLALLGYAFAFAFWKPREAKEGPKGCQKNAKRGQRDAKGRPRARQGGQGEAKGGQGEAKMTLGRLPWEHLGASLVKEDVEGKTSKLTKAFDEN